jgi:hypothetical protein
MIVVMGVTMVNVVVEYCAHAGSLSDSRIQWKWTYLRAATMSAGCTA